MPERIVGTPRELSQTPGTRRLSRFPSLILLDDFQAGAIAHIGCNRCDEVLQRGMNVSDERLSVGGAERQALPHSGRKRVEVDRRLAESAREISPRPKLEAGIATS
jgi:hypothetical protein